MKRTQTLNLQAPKNIASSTLAASITLAKTRWQFYLEDAEVAKGVLARAAKSSKSSKKQDCLNIANTCKHPTYFKPLVLCGCRTRKPEHMGDCADAAGEV